MLNRSTPASHFRFNSLRHWMIYLVFTCKLANQKLLLVRAETLLNVCERKSSPKNDIAVIATTSWWKVSWSCVGRKKHFRSSTTKQCCSKLLKWSFLSQDVHCICWLKALALVRLCVKGTHNVFSNVSITRLSVSSFFIHSQFFSKVLQQVPIYFIFFAESSNAVLLWSSRNVLWIFK